MKDINNMNIEDFNNLYSFISRQDNMHSHKPVSLRESNKRMIENTKKKKQKKDKW